MNEFEEDIAIWINEKYADAAKAYSLMGSLEACPSPVNINRIARCVLALSDSDIDSLAVYVKKAMEDYRNVIWWAEYDNRNIRKYNFDYSLYKQTPYSYSE